MPWRFLAAVLISTFSVGTLRAQSDTDDYLQWDSTAGTSVTARLVDESPKDKTITLENEEGKRVVVPLSKLTKDSHSQARKQIDNLRQAKKIVGVWYWRCPAKHESNWWIKTTLTRVGSIYRLDEESTGHSETKSHKGSYFYKKVGDVYLPIDEKNGGEKEAPFTIDSKGDRILYYRRIVANGKVVVQGGNFLEIYYAKKDDAKSWVRDGEKFPRINVDVPIYVGDR